MGAIRILMPSVIRHMGLDRPEAVNKIYLLTYVINDQNDLVRIQTTTFYGKVMINNFLHALAWCVCFLIAPLMRAYNQPTEPD